MLPIFEKRKERKNRAAVSSVSTQENLLVASNIGAAITDSIHLHSTNWKSFFYFTLSLSHSPRPFLSVCSQIKRQGKKLEKEEQNVEKHTVYGNWACNVCRCRYFYRTNEMKRLIIHHWNLEVSAASSSSSSSSIAFISFILKWNKT